MLKKKIGTVVVASALVLGMGTAASAAQSNDSSVEQGQSYSGGWASLFNFQKKSITGNNTVTRSAQGQSAFVRGTQTQVGKTTGAAEASQEQTTTVDIEDSSAAGNQTTEATGVQEQETTVETPSHVVQSQTSASAASHFQGSIKGGPTIQHQMNHNYSFQYSSSIFRFKK